MDRRYGIAIAAHALALLTTSLSCRTEQGTVAGGPSVGASSPASPAREAEWTAVRVDPATYKETHLGVIAFSDKPPFQARVVEGAEALKAIVGEMNALDHVTSTGLSGPGTDIKRDEDQFFRIMRGNWLGKVQGIEIQVRPTAQAKPQRFLVFDNKGGKNIELGVVAMKPSHYLEIIEAKEGKAVQLFTALREVNAHDGFSVDIPPPPGAQRGSYGRPVERGTPLFFTLMRDQLLHREHVVLIDASHSRPAELHRVALSGGGLAQIPWLEVDIDKSLSPASALTAPEVVRYEEPSKKLAFIVEHYDGVQYAPSALSELVGKRFGGQPAFKAGEAKPMSIAGRELLTMAFRTGAGDAATDHAVTLWPLAYFTVREDIVTKKGLLIHVSAPAKGDAPSAETSLEHAVIVRSIDSLYIDAEWGS